MTVRVADPQVAHATARYRPNLVGVEPARFERVVDVAHEALADLVPVVVANRRIDDATRLVEQAGTARFGTIHTSQPQGVVGAARRGARLLSEQLHDTHGTGENAGRTVFATTRFVGSRDAAAGARSVLDALVRQGSVGVEAYGPVSFVVPAAAVADRTTFAARDTAKGITRVTDASHMAEVVAERLARGAHDAPTIDDLISKPHYSAVEAVRGWLVGGALGRRDSYIEAQIRGLAVADVAAVHVSGALRPEDAFRTIDAGPAPTQLAIDRLNAAARTHGIEI